MRGVNKVIIVGTLGADPETRYTSAGTAVTSVRLAVNEMWRDKDGEKQERTEWISCTAFGKVAEIVGEYCQKGDQLYVEGRMRTDKYTDKDGIERYATKVMVETIQLLGGRRGDSERSSPGRNEQPSRRREPASNPPAPTQGGFEDDDIPF